MTEDNWWDAAPIAAERGAKPNPAPGGKAKTTPQDMIELRAASSAAQAERAARREYASTARAVDAMGTGPLKARIIDAVTPDPDGGFLDGVGAFLGAPIRALFSNKTLQARDQMNTVSAKTALDGSQQMKGSSSDKDTTLMRMAGVGPYKTVGENKRILASATRESGLAEARAHIKSLWISKYGSMAQASPNGMTYEQAVAETERNFLQRYKPNLPKAPPKRAARARVVIDINGNRIK